jgi:hypothetical protein
VTDDPLVTPGQCCGIVIALLWFVGVAIISALAAVAVYGLSPNL